MNLNDDFDFLGFWSQGGFQMDMDFGPLMPELQDYLLTKETFIPEYNGKIYVDVCSWETPWTAKDEAPEIYVKIKDQLLKTPFMKSYMQIYGEFSFTKIMMHRTPRGYINNYHAHSFDGTHFHVFLYVCPEERNANDGGLTELGEVIDKDSVKFNAVDFYQTPPKMVASHLTVVPNTGKALVINNLNPYFRHRVTEVLSDKPRYTVMLAFGYNDNCLINKDIAHL